VLLFFTLFGFGFAVEFRFGRFRARFVVWK
jgi:hypothetical protein